MIIESFQHAMECAENVYEALGTSVSILAAYRKENVAGSQCLYYRQIENCGEYMANIPCDIKLSATPLRTISDHTVFKQRWKIATTRNIDGISRGMKILVLRNHERFDVEHGEFMLDDLTHGTVLNIVFVESDVNVGMLIHADEIEI